MCTVTYINIYLYIDICTATYSKIYRQYIYWYMCLHTKHSQTGSPHWSWNCLLFLVENEFSPPSISLLPLKIFLFSPSKYFSPSPQYISLLPLPSISLLHLQVFLSFVSTGGSFQLFFNPSGCPGQQILITFENRMYHNLFWIPSKYIEKYISFKICVENIS